MNFILERYLRNLNDNNYRNTYYASIKLNTLLKILSKTDTENNNPEESNFILHVSITCLNPPHFIRAWDRTDFKF